MTEPTPEAAMEAARIALRRGASPGSAIPSCACFSDTKPPRARRCNEVCEDAAEYVASAITAAAQRARAEALEEAKQVAFQVADEHHQISPSQIFGEHTLFNDEEAGRIWASACGRIMARISALIQPAPENKMTDKPVYGQWQPIETAPKDGTEIMVFRTDPMVQAIGVDRINKYGQWTYSDNRHPPTHWMPLPDPPSPDTAETPEE